MISGSEKGKPIVFFDGVCHLCNRSVRFILKHDPAGKFRFATLQGETAVRLGMGSEDMQPQSIILFDNGRIYRRSGAALRIAGRLSGPARLLWIFLVIPPFIRDAVYNWIANNRYRWFGKSEQCMVPGKEWADRFINE